MALTIRNRTGFAILLIMFVPIIFSCSASGQVVKKRPDSPPVAATETAVNAPTSSMTIWQARKAVITGLQRVAVPNDFLLTVPSKIKVDAESIEFYASVDPRGAGIESHSIMGNSNCSVPGSPSGSTYKADLRRIGAFTLSDHPAYHRDVGTGLLVGGKEPFFGQEASLFGGISCSPDQNTRIWGILFWHTRNEAQSFANAMNRLRSAARREGDGGKETIWHDFQQKASAWRALPFKPPIPEEVRQHRLVAENAFREMDLDTAISEYEDGLTSYPVWPEGHFNAALLCAELGYYSEAIRHMRAYVELVPEALDAQQARDQIIIWQAKLPKD